jgi:thiol-disulfide isomerase/thioredoxin
MQTVKTYFIIISILTFSKFAISQNDQVIKLKQSDTQSKEFADFPADLCLFKYDLVKLKAAGFDGNIPAIKSIKDTAVAFLLINFLDGKFPQSYAPIFILNYKTNSPLIVYQSDLDKKNSYRTVNLKQQIIFNMENKGAVRYEIAANNTPQNERLGMVFPKTNFDIISSKYWLYQIPLFIKSGKFKERSNNIMIGLIDANQNGLYNDANTDKIFIAKKSEIVSTSESSSCTTIRQGLTLDINKQLYELIAVDKNGNAIQLKKSSKADNGSVHLLVTLPNLTYKNLSDIENPLSSNLKKGKFLFIYFWNTNCINCPQYIEELKRIYATHFTRLNILALNWENSIEEITNYARRNSLNWEHGLASPEVSIKLDQNVVPYGILFNENGDVVQANMSTDDLKRFFQK